MKTFRLVGACLTAPNEFDLAFSGFPATGAKIARRLLGNRVSIPDRHLWHEVVFHASDLHGMHQQQNQQVLVAITGDLVSPSTNSVSSRPAKDLHDAYILDGTGCFATLDGNFAAAIYDERAGKLILLRDIGGAKPLFYSTHGRFAFGSSAVDTLRASGLPAIAHVAALHRYLTQGISGGLCETLFAGIQSIPGRHYLELRPGCDPQICPIETSRRSIAVHCSWTIEDAAHDLRNLIVENVRKFTGVANTGVTLSGGLDSTGILVCMRHALGKNFPLHAFSFSDDNNTLPAAYAELPWIETAARHTHAELHLVRLDAGLIPTTISRVSKEQDFPVGSPVAFVQRELLRAAAEQGIDTLLNGHGPDAILGGSQPHVVARAVELLRSCQYGTACNLLRGAPSYVGGNTLRLVASTSRSAMRLPWRLSRNRENAPWLRQSWFKERISREIDHSQNFQGNDFRRVSLSQLYCTALPTALQIEECTSQATNVESRSPYLLSNIVALAEQLPANFLVSDNGQIKYILRMALREWLPESIFARKLHVGFAVPALHWLRTLTPWARDRFQDMQHLPFFEGAATDALWEKLASPSMDSWHTAFHAWRWIMLLEWSKAHNVSFR